MILKFMSFYIGQFVWLKLKKFLPLLEFWMNKGADNDLELICGGWRWTWTWNDAREVFELESKGFIFMVVG